MSRVQANVLAERMSKTNKHRMNERMEAGRVYYVTHQTPGSVVTGQTAYASTTPTFILYASGGALAQRGVLKRMTLSQCGTVAGGEIYVVVGMDTANRYSAGGTAVVPQVGNLGHSTASVWTFKYNATAAAATSFRVLQSTAIAAAVGSVFSCDFTEAYEESGLPFGYPNATTVGTWQGSLLIYTWAATTGPTWQFTFEYIED